MEAIRARANVARFAPGYEDSIICSDAASWLEASEQWPIDLLYIDAKSIDFDPKIAEARAEDRHSEYYKIVKSAMTRLRPGSLVLAHNSVNAAQEVSDYLDFVRSSVFRGSINLIIDDAGLEVSMY